MEAHFHGFTCHDSDVTVAIGQDIVERGLLRQTPDDRRLAERAHFLFLLYVEALHLIGQTHHLSSKQKDASHVNKDTAVSLQLIYPLTRSLYLESEKQLDGIGKRGWRWQTEPSDEPEEEEVDKGPAETRGRGMPGRQRHRS